MPITVHQRRPTFEAVQYQPGVNCEEVAEFLGREVHPTGGADTQPGCSASLMTSRQSPTASTTVPGSTGGAGDLGARVGRVARRPRALAHRRPPVRLPCRLAVPLPLRRPIPTNLGGHP